MKGLKVILILLMLLTDVICQAATSTTARQDSSLLHPVRIPLCVSKDTSMRCLHYPGDSVSMHRFYRKLANAQDTIIHILHIGDSHVQGGEISHTLRTRFAEGFGASDRGLLFPYRAAKTNSPGDYRIFANGRWTSARITNRNPSVALGLTGAAVITADSAASLLLTLRERGKWSFNRLTVEGEASDSVVQPILVVGSDTVMPTQGWSFDLTDSVVLHRLGEPYLDSCLIRFMGLGKVRKAPVATKGNPRPKANYAPLDSAHYAVVRGIRTESDRLGVVYSESGINGAGVNNWLRTTNLLEQQLDQQKPDLVICALATNDANVPPAMFDTAAFKANYRQLIDRILSVNPEAALLFLTGNDCWINVRNMRRQPNPNTSKARTAISELAREYNAPYFDVFGLMGGFNSADRWVRSALMRPDHIHFTENGYHLLGNIIYNAMMKDYQSGWALSDE